jgi:hypothetical protein
MYGLDKVKDVVLSFGVGSTVCGNSVWTGGANRIMLTLPTFSSGIATTTANVYVQGATGTPGSGATGTFLRGAMQGTYSAGAGFAAYEVPSTTGNIQIEIPLNIVMPFIKIELSNAATAATYLPTLHLIW